MPYLIVHTDAFSTLIDVIYHGLLLCTFSYINLCPGNLVTTLKETATQLTICSLCIIPDCQWIIPCGFSF